MRMLAVILPGLVSLCLAAEPLTLRTASQAGNTVKFDLAHPQEPGICVEIIRALERIDPGLHFVGLNQDRPLPRIELELANGQLDIFFSLIKTPERLKKVRFLDQPALYNAQHQVAVRSDDSVIVNNFADIRALGSAGIVLTTMGSAYAEYLKTQPGLIVDAGANNNADNFRKLVAGRGRFFYQSNVTLVRYIRDEKLADKVRILPAVFRIEPQLVAYSPHLNSEKIDRVAAALTQLTKSGELQRIQRRYGAQ
ncbi:substrate-binding periplasmic protein [Chitinimonas naiadis]